MTADGTEHTIKYTSKTTVEGAKDTGKGVEKGSVDTYLGAKKGTKVTVHYTEKGAKKTAVGVKDAIDESAGKPKKALSTWPSSVPRTRACLGEFWRKPLTDSSPGRRLPQNLSQLTVVQRLELSTI
jgi:hypothetical protein